MSQKDVSDGMKKKKDTEQSRNKINIEKKTKIMDYIKQLISIGALQQVITRNLEKEVSGE